MKPAKQSPAKTARTMPAATTSHGGRGERELQLKLELIVNVADRDRRDVFATAKALTGFGMIDQDRFLAAVSGFAAHPEVAYALCRKGGLALRELSPDQWRGWLAQIKRRLDGQGAASAVGFINRVDACIAAATPPPREVSLERVRPALGRFLTGLCKNCLRLAENDTAYTDTDAVYLPPKCSMFDTAQRNFDFYKTLLTYLWAQTAFGTWRIDIANFLYEHEDADKAAALYRVLETLRLDACIERELPGIFRMAKQIGLQQSLLPATAAWQDAAARLEKSGARSSDSIELIKTVHAQAIPPAAAYQGAFMPARVHRAINQRAPENRRALREALAGLLHRRGNVNAKRVDTPFTLKFYEQALQTDFDLQLGDDQVEIPARVREILEQIVRDFGEVPPDALQPARTGTDGAAANGAAGDAPEAAESESEIRMKLPEWDRAMQRLRRDWCHVYLHPGAHGDTAFAAQTRAEYRGIARKLNQTFEALREENRAIKRQTAGDEIDVDAATAALVDHIATRSEGDDKVFIRINKSARNVAVMFMVDASSSTHGPVNTIERKSLVLLCEALELLGDRYAVFGFSGNTRKHCRLYQVKDFDETYDIGVQSRIAGLSAGDYTRIGAAVRYSSHKLAAVRAKTKVLIVLSDGKPDDADGYRGDYGIEDTRKALLEARAAGIFAHCITIDKTAKEYLPYMYGHANFSIVSRVEDLPFKMADIYRRITS